MAIGASLAPRSICAFRCLSDRLFRLRCGRASVSRRLETIEFTDGERQLALAMFYPAALSDSSAKPTGLPFFTNLHLYRDAGLVEGRHPLVMLSHGRGSNPLQYAWFAETLASQGYIAPGSITIAPTLTTRASLTSPTRSGSGRATSRRQ
jgi:hypothetical protein